MRRWILLLGIMLTLFQTITAESITFSGGESSIVLRDGRENVVLSGGASVSVGTLSISADTITLSGSGWRFVTCSGGITVTDPERGITIRTSSLWYDREEERILISTWYEIDDTENEVSATGGAAEYLLDSENLRLDKDVSLLRSTDDGTIMRCRAESVIFSRSENTVQLRGSATVDWDGDRYEAEVISVNLSDETISLDGRIKGTING